MAMPMSLIMRVGVRAFCVIVIAVITFIIVPLMSMRVVSMMIASVRCRFTRRTGRFDLAPSARS